MTMTYVYLNKEDMTKLALGEKVEIEMTNRLRSSNQLFLQVDQTEKTEQGECDL